MDPKDQAALNNDIDKIHNEAEQEDEPMSREELIELAKTAPKVESEKDEKLRKLGIPPQAVAELKQAHGRIELAKIAGEYYIYRGMPRIEWRKLMDDANQQELDQSQTEERMAKACVLWPIGFRESIQTRPAGIVSTVANGIIRLSGFQLDEEPIEL